MRSLRSSLIVLGGFAFVLNPARAADAPASPAQAPAPSAAATASSPPLAPSTPSWAPTAPASAPSPPVDDPARAQALSDEAVALANDGDFRAACAKLEESLAFHDGLGTRFHLAGCWSKIGRTASAYALFESVAAKAHELGQADRETVARERMDALLPKLSRLRVDIVNAPPHTEVRRDGVVVPESDWGKPVPVDRGPHEIRVTADGKAPWSTHLDVTEPATVAVQVPALAAAPPPAPVAVTLPPAPPPAAPLHTEPPPAKPESGSDGSTQRTLSIVLGSVGVAGLAAGIVEGAQYLDSNREAKGICPSAVNCTEDEISRHAKAVEQARNERLWSYVGVGVGSAAVVGAAYLFFSAPHAHMDHRQRASAFGVAPWVDGRGTWGGAVHGSF